MYYFELFDLKPSLALDLDELNKRFLQLQKKYHPDFFGNAADDEQAQILQKSSDINNAFRTLKNEEKRLEYILKEKQIITDDEKFVLPPVFLMEVMELNESFDDNNSTQIKAFQAELSADVETIFAKKEISELSMTDWQNLKIFYYKKKYLQRILER